MNGPFKKPKIFHPLTSYPEITPLKHFIIFYNRNTPNQDSYPSKNHKNIKIHSSFTLKLDIFGQFFGTWISACWFSIPKLLSTLNMWMVLNLRSNCTYAMLYITQLSLYRLLMIASDKSSSDSTIIDFYPFMPSVSTLAFVNVLVPHMENIFFPHDVTRT